MSRFGVFLLGFLWALLAQAEPMLQASVDRTRLGAGESLELTLESQDVTQFGKPDLRALEGDFEVRGTRQLNSLHTLDGETRANGGFVIVRGGGVPALDVIGYNRRVDWDELVNRLQRVIAENVSPELR